MTNIPIAMTSGVVGVFGPAAIAGYGVGTRLEYLLVPLAFGFGGPLVALVGTNLGAGNRERALRAAWIGGWVCFAMTEAVGLSPALFSETRLSPLDRDAALNPARPTLLPIFRSIFGLVGVGHALH